MRPRSWTDDQLREALAASTTLTEVLERLGLTKGGATLEAVRKRMVILGLDPPGSHRRERSATWAADPGALISTEPIGSRGWSDADLAAAVRSSSSVAGVLRALGLKPGGSQYVVIQREIARLGLDRSHFTGRGWSKGRAGPSRGRYRRPLEEILVEDSDYLQTSALRERLIRAGVKEARCEICGLTEWNGASAPLQLDHINGERTDNRLENLRILCPNCHAQTETWCSRNRGRSR